MTLAGGSSRSSQGGSPGPESDHTSESGGLRLWSGSSSPPPADEQWPDVHTPPPSNPEIAAAPVSSNVNRDQQPPSSWVSDPNRASLRRRMGISANLDKQTQCNAARPRLVYSRVAMPPSLMYIYYRGVDLPPVATILRTYHTVTFSTPRLFSHIPFLS